MASRLTRAALLFTLTTVAMTWPIAAELGQRLPIGGDNLHLAWVMAWVLHSLARAPAHLFDGNIFYPARHTIAFSDPNVSSALIVAPAALLGASPAVLVNLLFLASFVLCGLAAYALAREWSGSESTALMAGFFFSFSPLRLSHVDHVQLYAFWWTPLCVLAADRHLRRGGARSAWLAGLCLVLQLYASVYLGVLLGASLGILLVVAVAGRSIARIGWRRRLLVLAPVFASVAVALLPLVIAYGSVNRAWGAVRSLEQSVRYAASPVAFLSAAPSNWMWGGTLARFADPVAPWEKYLFPGLVPVGLAVLAVIREPRSPLVAFGACAVAVGMIFALGPYGLPAGGRSSWRLPYFYAYEWLPPMRALRAPARWALLSELGLALLAAAGGARLPRSACMVLVAAALAEAWPAPLPTSPIPSLGSLPPVYRFLAGSGPGPLVELPLATTSEEQYRIEPNRVYASTLHWRPIANGYSGYTPSPYRALAELFAAGPSDAGLAVLAAWGIRTAVVHLDELPSAQAHAWGELSEREGVVEIYRDARTRAFEITRSPRAFVPPRGTLDTGVVLGGGSRQAVDFVVEAGDSLVTAPVGSLGWHTGRARWSDANGNVAGQWVRYQCVPVITRANARQRLYLEAPRWHGPARFELDAECFTIGGSAAIESENRQQ